MKDNENSHDDRQVSDNISVPIKSSRFENMSTFANHLVRYNIHTGAFAKSNKVKYASHNGGVPLGMIDDSVLVDPSDTHTMVFGSTGSKKSRLVVMPTVRILADAGESMIISDPKAEIFERSSGYLKRKGYTIFVINLRNPSLGDSWNPLYIPYLYYKAGDLDKAYEFANDIAANLCLAEVSSKDPFWDFSARDLFFGLELLLFKYCFENKKDIDFANIANLLRLRNYMFTSYYSSNRNPILDSSSVLSKYMNSDFITLSALSGTVHAPEKTQSSILTTFDEKMRCFTIQPKLLNLLSSNSVDFDHIGDQKTAIFAIMPDEKTTYHKLVTLFIKQSYEYIIYQAQQKNNGVLPIRVNYILDEFASLPTIKDFPAMIAAARSRNIRFNLVVQSKHQLLDKYGKEAATIQSNCTNWIFLTSREIALLEDLSILCGKKNNSDKPLVPTAALQHLNKEKGEALVLSGRLYPIIIRFADIKKYDDDQPLPPVRLEELPQVENHLDFSIEPDTIQKPPLSHNNHHPEKESIWEEDQSERTQESLDIQAELERKFDELFGVMDDDDW